MLRGRITHSFVVLCAFNSAEQQARVRHDGVVVDFATLFESCIGFHRGTIEVVLECAANLACVGAEPLGLTNCLNFGNPEKPHIAWQLTESVRGLAHAARTLEIQFLLHGTGPASEWAQRVKPGDKLAVAGPGGRFSLEPAADHWWLAADESAIPAVGTLLEALPETTAVDVHIEVDGPDDEVEFATPAKTTITWHRRRRPDAFGAELADAARAATIPDGARVWVACEAAAMRDIRRYLIAERHLPAASLVTRGYWRAGEQNHPDHDYGED